jgi:leader peptidase (prepilin peptidase) / N-methyltransferase
MIWLMLLAGLVLGPAINFAIYHFAYFTRPISPWQRKPKTYEREGKAFESIQPNALAKLPVIGWLTRSNERAEFGNWFWIRPLLIEIVTPIALVFLYRFVMSEGLVPAGGPTIADTTLTKSFVCISVLFALLTIATFIDFDERMIPDWVTVPGTLFALVGSSLCQDWRLRELLQAIPAVTDEVQPNSPWLVFSASWIQGSGTGLALALAFWWGWCFALLDRAWITRRGWNKAWAYFWAIIARSPSTKWIVPMAVVGTIGIFVAHSTLSADGWEGLFSSLFGIALGGVLVWSFRVVAAVVMQREALGFGDVTLMAMVGAFAGWQVVWIGFFLSPFFGLIFVVTMWIITRDSSTPFGPYLSMGVVFAILAWSNLWPAVNVLFAPPGLMVFVLCGLLVALAISLAIVQTMKRVFGGSIEE